MVEHPKVQVLLATYNGEKFLEEQLDSILSQTYPNLEILARDDRSTDNTAQILAGYESAHPQRIKIIRDSSGNLGGCTQNFQRLCLLSSTSVIAFADQDDIWYPQKVERSVNALLAAQNKYGSETPILIHHDFKHVDAARRTISESFDKAHGQWKSRPPQFRMPFASGVHGFSMTVNRSLLNAALPFPETVAGHDGLLASLASHIGVIEYVPDQLAEYRKHGNNVSHSSSFARRIFTKLFIDGKLSDLPSNLKSAFDGARDNLAKKQVSAARYIDRYEDLISPEDLAVLRKFADLDKLPFLERKRTLCQQPCLSWKSKLIAGLTL